METIGNKTIAVIVAAGKGERMGGVDKIFASLAGKPVLAWTLAAFQNCALIDGIILVVSRDNIARSKELVEEYKYSKVTGICPGGRERWQSVACGLEMAAGCRWVLVHDGARPLVTEEIIAAGLEAARETGAAIPVVSVTDTIKAVDAGGFVEDTLPRRMLRAVQTPQVFRFDIISAAYRNLGGEEPTDDASLAERLGFRVKTFHGSRGNIKITVPADLALAGILLKGGR